MRIEAWDSGFIRARRADLHPVLADVVSYGRWWPGMVSRPVGERAAIALRPPGVLRPRQRFTVEITQLRLDKGVRMRYSGDLEGDAEWYYLDEPAGAVVHYLLAAEVADRGWRRCLADHRASVRQALHELKDRFEGGRVPGAEPDPFLLADQRTAMAEFRAAVAQHSSRRRASEGV